MFRAKVAEGKRLAVQQLRKGAMLATFELYAAAREAGSLNGIGQMKQQESLPRIGK
jgi:hypothetical protein